MKSLPIFIIITLILLTRLFFYFEEKQEFRAGEKVSVEYTFTKEAKKSEFGQYFFFNNLMVSLPKFPVYEYGDSVAIEGIPSLKKISTGEILVLDKPQIEKLPSNNPFLAFLKPIRQRVLDSILSSIPNREAGLLAGILLGVRDKIDSDYYQQLRNAGVLHVVAASGQNITIIANLILLLFERVIKRKRALLLTAVTIVLYALLTGFDPPIVRASIMAIITFGAFYFGRQSSSLNILFLTAFVMLLQNPSLIEDVSFILSFLSTFGIVTLNPILSRFMIHKSISVVKEDIVTSISAQIATFPVLIHFFQSYSLISLPVNILVVFTVPFIMIVGGIGALVSLIHPVLSIPFYLLAYPFLYYFWTVVDIASNIDIVMHFDSFPLAILVGYYILLIAFIHRSSKSHKK